MQEQQFLPEVARKYNSQLPCGQPLPEMEASYSCVVNDVTQYKSGNFVLGEISKTLEKQVSISWKHHIITKNTSLCKKHRLRRLTPLAIALTIS